MSFWSHYMLYIHCSWHWWNKNEQWGYYNGIERYPLKCLDFLMIFWFYMIVFWVWIQLFCKCLLRIDHVSDTPLCSMWLYKDSTKDMETSTEMGRHSGEREARETKEWWKCQILLEAQGKWRSENVLRS